MNEHLERLREIEKLERHAAELRREVAEIRERGGKPWAILKHGALHGVYHYQVYEEVVALVEAPNKRKAQNAYKRRMKALGEDAKFGRFAHDAADLDDEFWKNYEIRLRELVDDGIGQVVGHMLALGYRKA